MTSLLSYGKVQETQPWNASVHACHDSSLSYKSLDIGPPSTLSLRHFNSTRVRHCKVELIPKGGLYVLSVFLQWSRTRSFGYQLYHIKASAIKVFLLHLVLGPLALMRIGVRPGGKAPHLIRRSHSHNQKAVPRKPSSTSPTSKTCGVTSNAGRIRT